jgi:hypothetical protein
MTPTQRAINGALDIFVEGYRADDVWKMLFGLSVLSSATETQVHAAMPSVESRQRVTVAEIAAMLAG